MSSADHAVYMRPAPELVAKIVDSKGLEAACERWHWLDQRTINSLARVGRVLLTGTAGPTRARSYTAEDAAVAVEAAYALGSMDRGERSVGLKPSALRGIIEGRGLPFVRISSDERGRMSGLGQRASRGDRDAAAAVAQQHALERAVAEVIRRALRLVAEQPAVGRYRLPELAAALADLPATAIAMVFPSLDGGEAAAPSVPTTAIEEPIMDARRKTPADAVIRADHAASAANPNALVDLAAQYGVSPKALYTLWKRLGLETTGRCGGMTGSKKTDRPKADSLRVAVTLAAAQAVRVETSDRLDIEGLALAAELARRAGIPPAQAIAFVRADRGLA